MINYLNVKINFHSILLIGLFSSVRKKSSVDC